MKKTALLLLAFLAMPLFAQQRETIWPKGKMPDAQDKQIAAMTNELGPDFKPESTAWHISTGSKPPTLP